MRTDFVTIIVCANFLILLRRRFGGGAFGRSRGATPTQIGEPNDGGCRGISHLLLVVLAFAWTTPRKKTYVAIALAAMFTVSANSAVL